MAFRSVFVLVAAVLACCVGASAQPRADKPLYIADLAGVIGPASVHITESAIAKAETDGAPALILRLNTPGGLSTSMREIVQAILKSRVPVIGYVAPSGGHAASAGTFILYATHVAAMAPGTNIGAASPVQIGGPPSPGPAPEQPPKDAPEGAPKPEAGASSAESAKAMNDAVALIRGLAQMHGRNAEWAEAAVRRAEALTASDALRLGAIEIIAEDVPALLAQIDGREVSVQGAVHKLQTKGARTETLEPSAITKALALLSNPNLALILMMIGVYGLIFEFTSPGYVAPGVVGAICLVLGLYALGQLPLNYAGLAMIALGLLLIGAEALSPNYGVLGMGGLISFILGAAMLIDTDIPAFQISPWLIAAFAIGFGVFLFAILGVAARSQIRRHASGADALAMETAQIIDWSDGAGHVWAQGERWSAHGEGEFAPGQNVRIIGRRALRLHIVPETELKP